MIGSKKETGLFLAGYLGRPFHKYTCRWHEQAIFQGNVHNCIFLIISKLQESSNSVLFCFLKKSVIFTTPLPTSFCGIIQKTTTICQKSYFT